MAVTDYKYPGTAANVTYGGYVVWNSPDSIKADDTAYSSALISTTKNPTDYLTGTNFGFTSSYVPSGATINGIELVICRSCWIADATYDYELYLLKDGTPHGSNLASATKWPKSSPAEATYGGSSNLCGGTWTQADVLDADFGFRLSCKSAISAKTGEFSAVDYFKIRVYYTEGGAAKAIPTHLFQKPFRHMLIR